MKLFRPHFLLLVLIQSSFLFSVEKSAPEQPVGFRTRESILKIEGLKLNKKYLPKRLTSSIRHIC